MARELEAADFNGDGVRELMLMVRDGTVRFVSERFEPLATLDLATPASEVVEVRDANNDGAKDMLLQNNLGRFVVEGAKRQWALPSQHSTGKPCGVRRLVRGWRGAPCSRTSMATAKRRSSSQPTGANRSACEAKHPRGRSCGAKRVTAVRSDPCVARFELLLQGVGGHAPMRVGVVESAMDTIPHGGDEARETGEHDDVAMVPRPGMVLAERYALVEPLGRGAAGWVWKAEHKVIRKHFAVKLLAPRTGSALGAESAARMLREAKSLSRFEHPNVIAVTDFGYLSETVPFIVMELLEGKTLQEILDEGRPSWSQAKTWAEQILDGVGAAHEHGVIHRDIKPSNLFVTAKHRRIKVLDFGLAAVTRAASSPTTRITVAGDVFGTPMTMSPEQIGGEQTDERSDLYSLGCVLYEMLAGQPPVQGEPAEVLYQHVYAEPTPLRSLASPDVPDHVCEVIHRCLAKAREDRPASCAEVRETLREPAATVLEPTAVTVEPRRARPWMLGVAGLACAGVLFGARAQSQTPQSFAPVRVDVAAPSPTSPAAASLWADPPRYERASPKTPVVATTPAPKARPRRRAKPSNPPPAAEWTRDVKPAPAPASSAPKADASNPNLKDPFAGHRGRRP